MAKKKVDVDINDQVVGSVDFNSDVEVLPEELNMINEGGNDQATVVENLEKPRPRMEDPEWTDWVMAQFEPEELDEGLPKVDGLRRLVRKLIGPILKGKAEGRQYPTIDNEQRATVEYTLVVLNRNNLDDFEEPY